jgi:thermitase
MGTKRITKILFIMNILAFIVITFLMVSLSHAKQNHRSNKEKSIKVMIIDTGLDIDNPMISPYVHDKKFDSDIVDNQRHGTHVTGIVLYGGFHIDADKNITPDTAVCKQIQIIPCKFFNTMKHPQIDNNIRTVDASTSCLMLAHKLHINYVNYSAGGDVTSKEEKLALKKLEADGTIIVAAAGNDHHDLSKHPFYPASYGYKNIITVGSIDQSGKRLPSSNYGPDIKYEVGKNILSTVPGGQYDYMTGTSQATAMYLHKLLIDKCKNMDKNK